jgi:hypothetical protein
MSIYLYIKTHNITGLKYLGKTKRNPYKYKGSGIDWIEHLKRHGKNVTTEVIHECKDNAELNILGRYYSTLYNVTGAMDDFGNKIWANRIPETGGGGDQSGPKNGMYGKTHALAVCEAQSNRMLGNKYGENWTPTEEQLAKMKFRARNREVKTCPHCGKNATGSNYTRWHGNNCKLFSSVNNDPPLLSEA